MALSFSIFGDSLSTYAGMNPAGYSVFYDAHEARVNGLSSARDTWWYRVIDAFNGVLCTNNAYSGSRVTGRAFPAATSPERLNALRQAGEPDLLLCYIGFNDFGYGVPIGKRHGFFAKPDLGVFADAYPAMLDRMKKALPSTKIVCATLLETYVCNRPDLVFPYDFGQNEPLSAYNAAIVDACHRKKVFMADLHQLGIVYPTLDGAHATAEGHRMMAEGWCRELLRFRLC